MTVIIDKTYLVLARLTVHAEQTRQQLMHELNTRRDVDLTSRSGEGSILWTILVVSLVAGVAALFLGPLGTRLQALGQQALSDVDSAKTW